MKKLALIFLLFCSPAWAAQPIQQASIDFLLSRPETLDVLMHAETWVFKSMADEKIYTAERRQTIRQSRRGKGPGRDRITMKI